MHIERTIAATTVSLLCAAALGAGIGSAASVGLKTVKVAPRATYDGMSVRYPHKVHRHRANGGAVGVGGGARSFDIAS
jgi:hypothetical protein